MKKPNLARSIVAGALGGLAASFVMNLSQKGVTLAERAWNGPAPEPDDVLPHGDDATVKTAQAISSRLLHRNLTEPEKKWAGPLVHYAFGTALGAAYGALATTAPVAKSGAGTAFGAAVWVAADEIAVPALGLSGPPDPNRTASRAKALGQHLIYGLTTHFARKALLRSAPRRMSLTS